MPGVLSDEDAKLLDTYKRNSKAYYEVGDYVRAEDQCRKGLALDDDDETLKLTLGYALLMQASPKSLIEARQIFSGEIGSFGTKDWRLQMGYGMTLQQLARLHETAPDQFKGEKEPLDIPAARKEAREQLEAANSAKNAPAEVTYHLAILDLEEGRSDLFPAHATAALAKLKEHEKLLGIQLKRPMGTSEEQRTIRERDINRERGRRVARELARAAWERNDWKGAVAAMDELSTFGDLARADHYDRARIRERAGNIEGAVDDLGKFIELSPKGSELDPLVSQAYESLTKLRAQLAEQRTATPLSSSR